MQAIRSAIGRSLDEGLLPLRRLRAAPARDAGEVVLVGGGPGDPDLLTLQGRRALAGADVVVVDRLGPREVIEDLAPGVLVLEVGKATGRHPVPQHAINQLLVDHAMAARRVVRLKGGDPFVFGRGGEEVDACRRAGVAVRVIPGVTSAFAVPLSAGIPVTHRGLSRQVTVIAGHDADGVVQADWAGLARSEGTLVVLMGVAALGHICGRLLAHGMPSDMPVAVIENGCTPRQRVTTGSLDAVAESAARRGVASPAVIVIGRVAAFAVQGG